MRIFISAVTSEFGKARDAIRSDFRARGHDVVVQSDFKQSPDSETLLGLLAECIRDCHAVICVVGKRAGACPPERAADRFKEALPKGTGEASYTQWEFFLARHFNRRRYRYFARDDYVPDQPSSSADHAEMQRSYIGLLKADGVHYTPFSKAEELRIAVMRDEPKIAVKLETEIEPKSKPIVLPYPSIGPLFKGRDEFMERLRGSLNRAHSTRTAIFNQALYGLGGIGKTRAAVEYARANADDYSALLFVVAETLEALRRNLAGLSNTLFPQLDTADDAVRLGAVLDWLQANPGWLLILDNVDTKEALAEVEHLLSSLAGGHLVITSRLADFSGHFQPLELDVLGTEDGAAFLLERTRGRRRVEPNEEIRAQEIAQDLGGLALALEQAAAYIAKRRLSFTQYLKEWRSKRDEILGRFDPTVTDYPRSVAVTWQTSVAQLSEGGRRLLERLAWLSPEKVPETLLDVAVPGADDNNLRGAYEDIASYSLVTRVNDEPFFLTHRLVQNVTRQSLAGEMRKHRVFETLRWINDAFPVRTEDVRVWPTAEPLLPHAQIVANYADNEGFSVPTTDLMARVGILIHTKALTAEAEPLFRRALAINEKYYEPDDPEVAESLSNLARVLQDTTRYIEAEPLIRRAILIEEKRFGADHFFRRNSREQPCHLAV